MPLLVIWLITSFAIRLLVVHFRLIILLRSRAKARFRGWGAQGGEGGRDVVQADADSLPNGRPCGRSPACTNSFLRLARKR
jgi:hypothetical protein